MNHPLIQIISIVAGLAGLWLLASSLRMLPRSLLHDMKKAIPELIHQQRGRIICALILIAIASLPQMYEALPRIVPFSVGLIVTLCVGSLVKHIKTEAEKDTKNIPCPRNVDKELWDRFIMNFGSPGLWIGRLERILFYIVLWMEKPELIAVFLVFKIAAKWEAWKNIVKVPEKMSGINELEFAIARRTLGAQRYSGFFIGTIGNILAALAGYGVTHLFK